MDKEEYLENLKNWNEERNLENLGKKEIFEKMVVEFKDLDDNKYNKNKILINEINNNLCSICYEIMISPKEPIILFPCGHSFCSICIKKIIKNCPLCRKKIENKAVNLSLKNLINLYHSNKNYNHSKNKLTINKEKFDNTKHEEKLDILNERKSLLKKELDKLIDEKNKFIAKLDNYKSTLTILKSTISSKKNQIENLNNDLKNLEIEENNIAYTYDKINKKILNSNEQITLWISAIKSIESEKSKLKLIYK